MDAGDGLGIAVDVELEDFINNTIALSFTLLGLPLRDELVEAAGVGDGAGGRVNIFLAQQSIREEVAAAILLIIGIRELRHIGAAGGAAAIGVGEAGRLIGEDGGGDGPQKGGESARRVGDDRAGGQRGHVHWALPVAGGLGGGFLGTSKRGGRGREERGGEDDGAGHDFYLFTRKVALLVGTLFGGVEF